MQESIHSRLNRTECKQLDRDHDLLFSLVAKLGAAIESQAAQPVLDKLMLELSAYFDAHFDNEEEFMEMTKYPEAEKHTAEHDRMRTQAKDLVDSVRSGSRERANEALSVLQRWFVSHVDGTDMALAEHLNRNLR